MIEIPVLANTNLSSSIILFTVASATTYKIYFGSKSSFAYTLLGFTFAFASESLAFYLINVLRHEITYDSESKEIRNYYARITDDYFYFLCSL
jgi:hypothetical protein